MLSGRKTSRREEERSKVKEIWNSRCGLGFPKGLNIHEWRMSQDPGQHKTIYQALAA